MTPQEQELIQKLVGLFYFPLNLYVLRLEYLFSSGVFLPEHYKT